MELENTFFQQPVFFDNDGAIDDHVALLLLLTIDKIRLTGISLTDAGGNINYSTESTLRILKLFCRNDIEIAKSNAKPINQFPEKWRGQCNSVNQIDELKNLIPDFSKISKLEGSEFMAQKILNEKEKTTIVLTGPATNLMSALKKHPMLTDKIEEVVWMSGALMEEGNVLQPDHDGSSEWNIYWNPISAKDLIHSGIKITLFPLDACHQAPVDNYIMFHLNEQKNKILSKIAHSIFSIPLKTHKRYYMWDVLTASFVGIKDIAHLRQIPINIETRGTSQGNMFKTTEGGMVKYADIISEDLFYDYFLNQMSRF